MAKRDESFEVEITGMAHGGSGFGRYRGRTVFVPFTIPGERVLVRPVSQAEHYIHAEGVRLLEASADRVYPACEVFGTKGCVRCHWQHMTYEAQLLLKQDVLADQLERVGKMRDVEVRSTIPSSVQWGYHYHMTFVVAPDGRLGLPGRDSKAVVTTHECQLLHPDLVVLYETLDPDLTGISRVRLQMGSDGAQMLIFTVTEDAAPELEADFPASVNLILPSNEPLNLIGESHSRYNIEGREIRATAGSYIRPNIEQIPNLVGAVQTLLDLREAENVLDLFAGVGIFSAALAPRANLVTLVESYPPAVTDADHNLSEFDNVDVIEGGVETVLQTLNERYDAAVIDPPPNGVESAMIGALARLGVKRLVYVSDDPAALARDSRKLAKAGYRLEVAQPIDLSPQTYYVDTVALYKNT